MTVRETLVTIGAIVALFVLLVIATVFGARADDRAHEWRRIATDQAGQLQVLNIACAVHPDGSAECPLSSFTILTTTTTTAR